jgi:hypothetical protein
VLSIVTHAAQPSSPQQVLQHSTGVPAQLQGPSQHVLLHMFAQQPAVAKKQLQKQNGFSAANTHPLHQHTWQ